MDKKYVSGLLYKEIFRNEINGYTVALFKIKDKNIEFDNDIINVTGIFPKLNEKKEYILYGNMVTHLKYGPQFAVDSFEIKMPSKEEELVTFLSSDLFPIGEKTAEKIVAMYHEDTINKILENKDCLQMIPRLNEKKIDKMYDLLKDYQITSNNVVK